MRIYLSAVLSEPTFYNRKDLPEILADTHILHSFAYANEKTVPFYKLSKSFLMDSGAFTVMNNKKLKNTFNPMEFVKKYGQHIKENNINNFLELDIDGVFGFEVYRDCLHCLQDITGKDPIPVYHKWRGIDYYKELVKKYNYIAIGDVPIGQGSRELSRYFPWFLEEAHKNNCRVHGLAFTSIPDLQFTSFDSVDSSSWTAGARFAHPFRFDGHQIQSYDAKRTEEKTLKHNSIVKLHDFLEWKKLSIYFDKQYEPIWE